MNIHGEGYLHNRDHRDFKDQRYKRKCRDYYEDKCEDTYVNDYNDSSRDRYNKDKYRTNYKDKDRNKYTHQYRDDSYDKNRGRSRERHCLPKAKKVDNKSKIE